VKRLSKQSTLPGDIFKTVTVRLEDEDQFVQAAVVETLGKVFGEEHPDTLTSMVNLATTTLLSSINS
jgi:hypothetical protein